MAINLNQTGGQRTPPAQDIRSAADAGFGQKVQGVAPLSYAPEKAFGDVSGQLAMGNALANAGNVFFDIAKREAALMSAEDDANLKRMNNQLNQEESNIRLKLEEEQSTTFRSPDEKLAEYQKRMEAARGQITGKYDFKTKNKEQVEKDFDTLLKSRETDYRAGKYIMGFRTEQVKAQYDESLMYSVAQAKIAGQENQPGQMLALLGEIGDTTSSSQFIAAVGGPSQATMQRVKMSKEVITGFLEEYITKYPTDAMNLMRNTDSIAAATGLPPEEAALMMEDVRKISEPIVQREISVAKSLIEDEMTKIELGIEGAQTTSAEAFAAKLQALDPNMTNTAAWKKLRDYKITQANADVISGFTKMNQADQRDTLSAAKDRLKTSPSIANAKLVQSLEKSYTARIQAESSGNGLSHYIDTQAQYMQPTPVVTSESKDIDMRIQAWESYSLHRGYATNSRYAPPLIDQSELSQMRQEFSKGGATPEQVADQFTILFESKFKGKLHHTEYAVQVAKMREQIGRFDPAIALLIGETQRGRDRIAAGREYESSYFPSPQESGRRKQ